ncbi:FAS-associated factor 2-A-like [Argonauta hians]
MAAGKRSQKRQTASKRPAESTSCSSSVSCLGEDIPTHSHPKRIKNISSNQESDIYRKTLQSTIKDSLKLSASSRKPLILYLYGCDNDRQLLSKTVLQYLENRFEIWAQKLESGENKKQVFSSLKMEFGNDITQKVKQYKENRLPVALVLGKVQCNLVVLGELEKVREPVKFQAFLDSVSENFSDMIKPEILSENLREERASLMREQDREYEESLKKDREKEERKRLLKEKKLKEEKAEEERKQYKVQFQMSDEPNTKLDKSVTIFRFRTPTGNVLMRRFLVENTIKTVLSFVESHGYSNDSFKVLTFHPKQDLTQLDGGKLIKHFPFYPRMTLYIHRRH